MKLKNPFTKKTRNLYLYEYGCWECGRSDRGLELNHIFGRMSASPYNASVLCLVCHSRVGHSYGEHVRLLSKAIRFLAKCGYEANKDDLAFISKVKREFDEAVHNLN